jgi:hypothetical protein
MAHFCRLSDEKLTMFSIWSIVPKICTVRPEPVEGLSYSFRRLEKKGQGFDRLSPNGIVVQILNTAI